MSPWRSGRNAAPTRSPAQRATDRRQRDYRATVIKLGAFTVVMVMVFVGLVVVFSQYRSGSSYTYTATFSDISRLDTDSRVRVAGVEVGSVTKVWLDSHDVAHAKFTVDSSIRLPATARALVRYQNLTGDRYLELQQGTGGDGSLLPDGGSIPQSQTQPALDLDTLLGGFKPLFRTLKPSEVNALSESLVAVFQGQGPALTQLLTQTAEFTNTLADRDALIGSVITNLNAAMTTFADDAKGLDSSIDLLSQLITGLSRQRTTIGTALTETASATTGLASLLQTTRPDIAANVTEVGQVADQILPADTYIRGLLQRMPGDLTALSNVGSYGAWLQLYLCRVTLYFTGPNGQEIVWDTVDATGENQRPEGRCHPR
ncbi:virulence factor Mce family protein [Gordonia jinhuaensis]|uniref:Mce family protein Mce3B n=1 Tax=Gordonia jinhuaensis TaxID=1517702 RepID=A0A916TKE4_9ACTN|nr:MlaD family protein [Gordonia jinhuaensis]GGB45456.1 Mce family protein Mce3B [Gordonia jinhuaensis]